MGEPGRMTRHHLCWAKDSLLIDVVKFWPEVVVRDGDGKPFETLREAVQAVMGVPTPNVPIGCPTPDAEGRCPGHPEDGEA